MNSAAKWQKKKKKFSSHKRLFSSSFCPHSLLIMVGWSVRGAAGTQQHPGRTAFHVVSQYMYIVFSHVEKVKAFCTEKKEKDPWMSSFILCFHLADVGIFVIDMHLQTSLAKVWVVLIFHYDYLLFLLSWLLTFLSDSNVYFMGSSLPMSFLLHTVGLSLYFKKLKIKKRWNCH